MIEAIQSTAVLFAFLAFACVHFDKDMRFFEGSYIYGGAVVITLMLSIAVIVVTTLIRIWT